MLTRSELMNEFKYDASTGLFSRSRNRGKWLIGSEAGGLDAKGYVCISINGSKYKAHRLAFLYMVGEIPSIVDHVNGVRNDNRWCNLRSCNANQNAFNRRVHSNNVLGIKGVAWVEARNRFTGTTMCKGVLISKDFYTLQEATDWVSNKRMELHKEFAHEASRNDRL